MDQSRVIEVSARPRGRTQSRDDASGGAGLSHLPPEMVEAVLFSLWKGDEWPSIVKACLASSAIFSVCKGVRAPGRLAAETGSPVGSGETVTLYDACRRRGWAVSLNAMALVLMACLLHARRVVKDGHWRVGSLPHVEDFRWTTGRPPNLKRFVCRFVQGRYGDPEHGRAWRIDKQMDATILAPGTTNPPQTLAGCYAVSLEGTKNLSLRMNSRARESTAAKAVASDVWPAWQSRTLDQASEQRRMGNERQLLSVLRSEDMKSDILASFQRAMEESLVVCYPGMCAERTGSAPDASLLGMIDGATVIVLATRLVGHPASWHPTLVLHP